MPDPEIPLKPGDKGFRHPTYQEKNPLNDLTVSGSKHAAVLRDIKEEYAERLFSKGLEAAKLTIDRAFHMVGPILFKDVPVGMEGKSAEEIVAYKRGAHDFINKICIHLYPLYADGIFLEDPSQIAKTGKVNLTIVDLDSKYLEGWVAHKELVSDVLLEFYKSYMGKEGTPEYQKGRADTWSKVSTNINNIIMATHGQVPGGGFRSISL